MKKLFFTLAIVLISSTSSFAECRSLDLGFVTIISGTTYVEKSYWIDNGTTFVQITELEEIPCSDGNRWQWFWE
jgi:hypothetical protein